MPAEGQQVAELFRIEVDRLLPLADRFVAAAASGRHHGERSVRARDVRVERERRLELVPRAIGIAGHQEHGAGHDQQHGIAGILGARFHQRRLRVGVPSCSRQCKRARNEHLKVGISPIHVFRREVDRFARVSGLREIGDQQ